MKSQAEYRRALLRRCGGRVGQIYGEAVASGVAQPVVMVLDLRDPAARQIGLSFNGEGAARGAGGTGESGGAEAQERQVKQTKGEQEAPLALGAMSYEGCMTHFAEDRESPSVERMRRTPLKAGHFWAMVVAGQKGVAQ